MALISGCIAKQCDSGKVVIANNVYIDKGERGGYGCGTIRRRRIVMNTIDILSASVVWVG